MENIQIQQNKLKTVLKLGLKKYHRLKLFEKIVLEHPKNIIFFRIISLNTL